MNLLEPALLPKPDGTIDAGDRLHLLGLYSGLAPAGGGGFSAWFARRANVVIGAGRVE